VAHRDGFSGGLQARFGKRALLAAVVGLVLAGCASGAAKDSGAAAPGASDRTTATGAVSDTAVDATDPSVASTDPSTVDAGPAAPSTAPLTVPPAVTASPRLASLAGHTIVVDPGHNGNNAAHPKEINAQVFIGNGSKACDSTGTAGNDGYPEHAFTFDVATRLQAILSGAGAHVVMARPTDDSWVCASSIGPASATRPTPSSACRSTATGDP
jgi:N-acetylmuramoyl-L-alanine amidase